MKYTKGKWKEQVEKESGVREGEWRGEMEAMEGVVALSVCEVSPLFGSL